MVPGPGRLANALMKTAATQVARHVHPLLAKAALVSKSALSPAKSDSANNNTAVSEYENQIQNDLWPLDCIKCHTGLHSLDNFNIHMNDHW